MPKVLWSDHQIAILIDEFEKYPILHNTNHSTYRNTKRRNEAFNNILEVIREVRPETTESEMMKKIKGFRVTYAAECTKILESEKIATCPEEVYIPNIWYFYKLRFLNRYIKTKVTFKNLFGDYTDELSDDLNDYEYEETDFDISIVKPEDILDEINSSLSNENYDNVEVKIEPNNTESESENFVTEEIVSKLKSNNKRKSKNDSTKSICAKRKKHTFDDWKRGLIKKLDEIKDEDIQIELESKIDMIVFEALMKQACK